MGRCSFEEIREPLPNRRTILISNITKNEDENCTAVNSFAEALEKCKLPLFLARPWAVNSP